MGQIAQEIHDLLGRLGHFAGQRYLGMVGIAQQPSFFLAQLQNFLQQWAVIKLGMGKLCRGAGGVGAVKLFTQMAAVRVLHDRQIARHLECELVAGMTVCRCCRLGGLQYISGNTLHFFCRGKHRPSIGGVEHMFTEKLADFSQAFLNRGKSFFGLPLKFSP